MVDRSGKDDLILSESFTDSSEGALGAVTLARPTASRESAQRLGCTSSAMFEPLGDAVQIPLLGDSATEAQEESSYHNMSYAEHVILESRSFMSRATDVDDHDAVRQIPLARLAQG